MCRLQQPRPRRARQHGFTLTELLVAMLLFSVLMSSVVVLFSASVTSVRESYARSDTDELGRAAMAVIARDLETSFTAREQGEVYSFFGTPYGFMFTGVLDSGQLGRVTYALRDTGQFFDMESMRTDEIAAALNQNANQDEIAAVTERTERRRMYWLIRYEEPRVSNLDNFKLPQGMSWPVIDPINSSKDYPPTPVEYGAGPNLKAQMVASVKDINGSDFRDAIFKLRYAGSAQQDGLQSITDNTISKILDSRKRELWIDMVAGRAPFGNVLTAAMPSDASRDFFARVLAEKGYEIADYVLAENILASNAMDGNGDTIYKNGVPVELPFFTFAGPDGTKVKYFNAVDNLNFWNASPEMYRGLINGNLLALWLTDYPDNYPGIFNALRSNIISLGEFDNILARLLEGKRSYATAFGLPLLPRLPSLVEPNFEVARPPLRVGGASFHRQFSQAIEVPAGYNRGLPPNFAPSPS